MSLLNAADCRRIEEAIARVEKRSAAEFVVAVVPKSGDYSTWRALAAAGWAIALAIATFRFVPWGGEVLALVLQIPAGLVAWALLGIGPLHRLLIPPAAAERAVRGEACRLFLERGVHTTKDRTGMLLLISELEHRVVLLGDLGIHARVGTEGWERHVEHLIRRIRDGKTADGVVEIIDRLEATLEANVPVLPADENELSNRVVRDP